MAISANIFQKCLPAIGSDIARCGGVTLCDISPTGEDELAGIFQDGSSRRRIIGAMIEGDFMGKSCQIQDQGMYDFIRATTQELGTKKLGTQSVNGMLEVTPFVKMRVKDPINTEYWTVQSGVDGDGTIATIAYNYTCLVTNPAGVAANVLFFPVGDRVFIEGKAAGGSSTHTAWKVVHRVIEGAAVRLYCTDLNTASFLPAAKLESPTIGLLVRGTPNVSDFERYCSEIPALNTNRNQLFWVETTRYTMCQDDLVDKYVNLIKDNNLLYKEFEHVPQVEFNKQLITDFQKRHAWAFFYNKPLPNQNSNNWDALESITIPVTDLSFADFEGRCVGRRAAATGIIELLAECNRVSDLQGAVLNLHEMFEDLYVMQQIRESIGSPTANLFELWMPSRYAKTFEAGMIAYYKAKSVDTIRLQYDLAPKMQQANWGFQFKEFDVDWPSVKIRIVTHRALDHMYDRRAAVSSTIETTGRFIWIFDWSTIYQGVLASNSVTNRTGNIGDLASVSNDLLCVMKVPQKSQKLVSVTYTNVMECAKANRIYENIGAGTPEHVAKSADANYTDYAGEA